MAVHISNLMKRAKCRQGLRAPVRDLCCRGGGVNMDIGGQSYAPLIAGDSNPGRVQMSLGGVGRNIAHNMALLGLDVRLLTAFGDDLYAQRIAASCGSWGLTSARPFQVPGGSTSTYLYLNGPDGDMALAVSDMDICQKLTPSFYPPA